MKILQINKFFYRKAGTEVYMFDLADLLKKQGHEVIEFSMQDARNKNSAYSQYFIKNIDFNKREGLIKDFKKALHLLYSFETKHQLETLIKKTKPDIAHLHNFNFQLTPSILSVLKKHKIPVVWTMHDYKLICPNYRLFTQGQRCERCKVYKYYNCFRYKCIKDSHSLSFLAMLEMYLHKLILKSYNKINLFISPSKFLQAKVGEWGIAKDKVQQVYNFVDISKFKPNFIPGEGVLYYGRLSTEKGLFTLLKAFKELPEINLQIVGAGPQKEQIKQYISDHKLNNVKLLGYKKGQELFDLIRNSRFIVVPSGWYENNPLTILEAFAMAKPVIGSDLGGISELVTNGQTGLLFKPDNLLALKNTIKNNYNNLELIEKMGQNARLFAEKKCSPQVHLEQILQIYQNLTK